MKVEKKAPEGCVVELAVKAEPDEIKDECRKVLNMFVREGEIAGFRKGKAPVDVVRRKFHESIMEESRRACFQKIYPQALKEAGVEALELAGVSDVILAPETGFSFTAHVEVKPDFSLPKYKKLPIKRKDAVVADEDVEKRVESFRRAFAKYEDPAEGDVIGDGDFVQFDYNGTLGGKPLSEIVPDQKAVCGSEGFWAQILEGQFLPEILAALKGMKAGDKKDGVKVVFPKDAAPDALKGKKCEYSLAVRSFRRCALPDDAAFAAAAKVDSVDALRQRFRKEMEDAATAEELENRRNQAIDLLLKKSDFDVPPSYVRRQASRNLEELARRAQYSGMTPEYVEQNRDKILADAQNSAIGQVRLSYILAGIAEAEKIEATDGDVSSRLEKIAAGSDGKVTAAELRERMASSEGGLEGLKEQIKAEKALDFVLAEAK